MSIFPQIRFDKITLTGGSKAIVVNDPHIDVTDGPLLLREGIFTKRNDFYDLNIQMSAFENGTAVGPANWLKNIEYLKYIKIAVFASFYENDNDGQVPQNYTTNDILSLNTENDIRDISNLIIYDALGLTNLPFNSTSKPEQYEVFSFGSLIDSPDDYIKFQDDDGNYIIPLTLTLKFPKQTNHLQVFAIPFLDLESLAFDYKIDIKNTVSIKDILENPFYYSLNIINNGESQDSDIIINNIITDDISKINFNLPKDDILPALNVDKNKVFNSTSISNLYHTKNEFNQDVLFFFVNSKDLIFKNSPFANSLIGKQIPEIIKQSLENSTFKINLINDKKKVSKINNKLGNQILSTKDIKNTANKKYIQNLNFIPNFVGDFELYYYVGDEVKENNVIQSYELEITIKDNLLETLIDYYRVLSNNLSQIKNYIKIVEIPYVKERTFLIDNPHIDVESTEKELTLPAFGFYDLASNSIKNIPLLEKQLESLNTISNNKYYSINDEQSPIQNFASRIENDLLSSLRFIMPLFNLDESIIKNLKVLKLIKPETASIDTLTTLSNIHKDIITSVGKILESFGMLPSTGSSMSSSKKKAIIKYNYEFKQSIIVNNYFNNFRINKFTPLKVNNAPFPIAGISDVNQQQYFTPKFVSLFGSMFQLDKEKDTTVNSDLGRVIQYFYELINKETELTQDIYSFVNKEQKESEAYSSFASLLSNQANIDIAYIATNNETAKQKIDSYSYNFIYSSKQDEKKETNDSNLIDKSQTLINELEERIQSNELSKISKQKQIKKLKKNIKTFNIKMSDVSEGIDKFVTQLVVAPEINLETINISEILPNFKIETLLGFEDGNLSLPIWQTISDFQSITSPMFCRILIDSSQVANKQLINKALSKLEYPNKYFIIGI